MAAAARHQAALRPWQRSESTKQCELEKGPIKKKRKRKNEQRGKENKVHKRHKDRSFRLSMQSIKPSNYHLITRSLPIPRLILFPSPFPVPSSSIPARLQFVVAFRLW
jgi:hypothetical protein